MYTQDELWQVRKLVNRRARIAAIPAAALFLAAVALFVYGQIIRSDWLWMVTAAATIAAGCWFLFLYGVYVRPMRMYAVHVNHMLNGRRHETTGVLKSVGEQICQKNEVDCYPVMLNVGSRDEGEDDRLFYFDVRKKRPDVPLGTRVTIQSNDMMVADFQKA